MARPPHARERVLDAFEAILLDDGERAATIEATAKRAGVSKGGALYHFPSKDALAAALIERLHHLVAADIDEMQRAEGGIVDAFIRSSFPADVPLDRALIATGRLASGGNEAAAAAFAGVRVAWRDALRPAVPDEEALTLVLLVADGVYFNQILDIGSVPQIRDLDGLIGLVQRVATPSND